MLFKINLKCFYFLELPFMNNVGQHSLKDAYDWLVDHEKQHAFGLAAWWWKLETDKNGMFCNQF